MNIPADIFSVFLIDLPLSTFQTATGESPWRFSVFYSKESRRSLEMVNSFYVAFVLSAIHFPIFQKLVVVGYTTFLKIRFAALILHIVTTRFEKTVKALIHKVI